LSGGRHGHWSQFLGAAILLADDFRVEELLQVGHENSAVERIVNTATIDCQLQQTMDKIPRNIATSTYTSQDINPLMPTVAIWYSYKAVIFDIRAL